MERNMDLEKNSVSHADSRGYKMDMIQTWNNFTIQKWHKYF